MKDAELRKAIKETPARSAWAKGVQKYALELVEEGAWMQKSTMSYWKKFSYGGCSLIYNEDIAKRLCTPSELKKTKNGRNMPNSGEDWLDVQARALYQANALIVDILRHA